MNVFICFSQIPINLFLQPKCSRYRTAFGKINTAWNLGKGNLVLFMLEKYVMQGFTIAANNGNITYTFSHKFWRSHWSVEYGSRVQS